MCHLYVRSKHWIFDLVGNREPKISVSTSCYRKTTKRRNSNKNYKIIETRAIRQTYTSARTRQVNPIPLLSPSITRYVS